jgi:hypothetical protein
MALRRCALLVPPGQPGPGPGAAGTYSRGRAIREARPADGCDAQRPGIASYSSAAPSIRPNEATVSGRVSERSTRSCASRLRSNSSMY